MHITSVRWSRSHRWPRKPRMSLGQFPRGSGWGRASVMPAYAVAHSLQVRTACILNMQINVNDSLSRRVVMLLWFYDKQRTTIDYRWNHANKDYGELRYPHSPYLISFFRGGMHGDIITSQNYWN